MARRHFSNHDEIKTQRRMCFCGHTRAEHEIHPDEHCYKCDCKAFKWKRRAGKEGEKNGNGAQMFRM